MNEDERQKLREANATDYAWKLVMASGKQPKRVDRVPGHALGGLRYEIQVGPRIIEAYMLEAREGDTFTPSVFCFPGLNAADITALETLMPSMAEHREKLTPEEESAVRVLVEIHPGTEEEWAAFGVRNRFLLDHLGDLGGLVNFASALEPKEKAAADHIVAGYLKLCAEDFREIMTLCGHGYGIGGLKLLRPMYELAVTAHYVHRKPSEADRLCEYAPIQSGKHSKRVREAFGEFYPREWLAALDQSIASYEAAKSHFAVPECKRCAEKGTCSHTRTAYAWGPTIETMALKSPAMKALYLFCYSNPLFHTHATLMALTSRLRHLDGEWRFNRGSQRDKADMVLMHAHLVLLAMVSLQREHFSLHRLAAPLLRCKQAFHEIWSAMGYPTEALDPETARRE